MSTRSTVHFHYGKPPEEGEAPKKVRAIIYKHSDGYPEAMFGFMEDFFDEVQAEAPGDTRFDDPSYLAAKFVVYISRWYSGAPPEAPLRFLSVGVMMDDPGDIEYRYDVYCGGTRPTVKGWDIYGKKWIDPVPHLVEYRVQKEKEKQAAPTGS